MYMSVNQSIIIILLVVLGTMITRFLPFIIFTSNKPAPEYVQYLGKALPGAALGMLVIYSLKDINFFSSTHGVPEIISSLFVIALHLWKRNMLLSIAGGTILYMLLIQFIFV